MRPIGEETETMTLHVWTADSEEWVVAESAEDACAVYCEFGGWTPADMGEDGDYGTHPSHWSELPDDKPLPWGEECEERHVEGVACPRACDSNFILHTKLTCGDHVKKNGRGYLGSANT